MFTILLLRIFSGSLKYFKKGQIYGIYMKRFRIRIVVHLHRDWWINNRVQPANLLNSVEFLVAYHVQRNHRVNCPLIYTDCRSFGQTMAAASVVCACVCHRHRHRFVSRTKSCSAYSRACSSYTVVKPVSHAHNGKRKRTPVCWPPATRDTHIYLPFNRANHQQ